MRRATVGGVGSSACAGRERGVEQRVGGWSADHLEEAQLRLHVDPPARRRQRPAVQLRMLLLRLLRLLLQLLPAHGELLLLHFEHLSRERFPLELCAR